jgi:hypothetical protein
MTPRTNKLIKELGGSDNSVFADFTRQLERELNELLRINKNLCEQIAILNNRGRDA